MIQYKRIKIIAVGNSTGIILPKELLGRLSIKRGDYLMVRDYPPLMHIELMPVLEDFDRQMRVAEEVMARRRNVLRKLAD